MCVCVCRSVFKDRKEIRSITQYVRDTRKPRKKDNFQRYKTLLICITNNFYLYTLLKSIELVKLIEPKNRNFIATNSSNFAGISTDSFIQFMGIPSARAHGLYVTYT